MLQQTLSGAYEVMQRPIHIVCNQDSCVVLQRERASNGCADQNLSPTCPEVIQLRACVSAFVSRFRRSTLPGCTTADPRGILTA